MKNLRTAVRPVVTMLFAGAFVAGFFLGKVSQDAFVPVVGMVIGFWFQSRTKAGE